MFSKPYGRLTVNLLSNIVFCKASAGDNLKKPARRSESPAG
jgi:hypothetical protein